MYKIIRILTDQTVHSGDWEIALLSNGSWGYINRYYDKRTVGDMAEVIELDKPFKYYIKKTY